MAEVKKVRPLKTAAKVKKITVKLTKEDKKKLPMQILEDGYNMREKSKWVVEAVVALLKIKDWEGALMSQISTKPDDQDVFTFPSDVVEHLTHEAHRVSMERPSLKANQSTIIRAAINRRMMGLLTI